MDKKKKDFIIIGSKTYRIVSVTNRAGKTTNGHGARKSPQFVLVPYSGSSSTIHRPSARRRPRPTPPPQEPIPDIKPVFRPTSMVHYRAIRSVSRKYKYIPNTPKSGKNKT